MQSPPHKVSRGHKECSGKLPVDSPGTCSVSGWGWRARWSWWRMPHSLQGELRSQPRPTPCKHLADFICIFFVLCLFDSLILCFLVFCLSLCLFVWYFICLVFGLFGLLLACLFGILFVLCKRATNHSLLPHQGNYVLNKLSNETFKLFV